MKPDESWQWSPGAPRMGCAILLLAGLVAAGLILTLAVWWRTW